MSGHTSIRNTPSGTIRSRRQGTNARLSEVTRLAARAERRDRLVARARGASPRILLGLAALGLIAGAGYWAWRTAQEPKWTGLRTVRVVSEGRVGAHEAVRLSGLAAGRNLFSLDLELVKKRLAVHPWVARVGVSRDWPHGVRIELSERQPVARLANGKWIARDGVVLDPRGLQDLPLLASPVVVKTRSDSATYFQTLQALAGMKAAGRTDVEIRILRGGSLEVRQAPGEPIALVEADSWRQGLSRWSLLRGELGEHWHSFSEIDLRHGSCAALRRAQGGT